MSKRSTRNWLVLASVLAALTGMVALTGCLKTGPKVTVTQISRMQFSTFFSDLAFSPDGSFLACTYGDRIAMWDRRTGDKLRDFKVKSRAPSIAVTPDGQQIAAGEGSVIRLYDAQTGDLLSDLNSPSDTFDTIRLLFSPDGNTIATIAISKATSDSPLLGLSVILIEVESGRELGQLRGHTDEIRDFAFSKDGLKIVTASRDGTARVWDTKTGRSLSTFTGHTLSVEVVTISPDGSRIVSGSLDGSAIVWDAQTSQKALTLQTNGQLMHSVAYSPDGKWIAGGMSDGSLIIWEAQSGQMVQTLAGHTSAVRSLDFSSDGTRIATGSGDGVTIFWSVATE